MTTKATDRVPGDVLLVGSLQARGGEYEWTFTVTPGEDLRFADLHYGQAAIDSARRHLPEFGVASVCGYGRVDPAELPGVLRVHRECAGLLPGVTA